MFNSLIKHIIKPEYIFYYQVLEFLFLLLILYLILHYINKLVRLPRFMIFFITIDLFLIFPRFTLSGIKFLLWQFIKTSLFLIKWILKLFTLSRIELIIYINLIFLLVILYKFLKKKHFYKEKLLAHLKNKI